MGSENGHRSHVNGRRGRRLLQRRQDDFDFQCKRLEDELSMRVVLSPEEYRKLKDRVFVKQHGRCADCPDPVSLDTMQLHHEIGRGIGGGFRMDVEELTRGVCWKCHPKADRNKKSKWIVSASQQSKTP